MLTALAFAAPLTAFAATQETDFRFPVIMRLGVIPLFLFSGTFFPISQLPGWLQPFCWLSPLWHGVQLCRGATTGMIDLPRPSRTWRSSARSCSSARGHPHLHQELDMTAAPKRAFRREPSEGWPERPGASRERER